VFFPPSCPLGNTWTSILTAVFVQPGASAGILFDTARVTDGFQNRWKNLGKILHCEPGGHMAAKSVILPSIVSADRVLCWRQFSSLTRRSITIWSRACLQAMVVQNNVFHNVFAFKFSNPSGSKTLVSRKNKFNSAVWCSDCQTLWFKNFLVSKQIPKSKLVG